MVQPTVQQKCKNWYRKNISKSYKKNFPPQINSTDYLKSIEQRACNWLNKDTCPLEQKCLTTNIDYKVKATSSNGNYPKKVYCGSCETTFKKRFSNHKKSFNLIEYENNTELSKEI